MNEFVIENDKLKVCISSLGATIVRFIHKNTNTDIVLGFDSYQEYLANRGLYLGTIVGRCANRIENGHFELNGIEYSVPVNNGPNSLHGGINGFSFREFETVYVKSDEVCLKYLSADNEEGYPGNLEFKVVYRLIDDYLLLEFNGVSDKDTVFNITNHSYFNLGDKDILDEEMYIPAETYAPVDENGLSLEEDLPVANTSFDFREFKRIGDALKVQDIDNNYVYENLNSKLMCQLRNDRIMLSVYSDLPDMHIYTANYFNGETGKNKEIYSKYKGVAIECQYYPNAINYQKHIKPVLKANNIRKHYIRYQLEERQ